MIRFANWRRDALPSAVSVDDCCFFQGEGVVSGSVPGKGGPVLCQQRQQIGYVEVTRRSQGGGFDGGKPDVRNVDVASLANFGETIESLYR